MGKALSTAVKRPLQNYNVENRAFKELERSQLTRPQPAPKHESSKAVLEQFQQENPELLDLQSKKSDKLHSMLDGMVVNPEKVNEIVSRPLPTERTKMEEPEFGYAEPKFIPKGRATLRQAMEFINKTHKEPESYSAAHIAQEYKLEEATVENILKNFQVLHIQVPDVKHLKDSKESTTSSKKYLGSFKDLVQKKED